MHKVLEEEVKVTKAMINKVVGDESLSKSAKMKALFDLGMTVKDIAVTLNVRYNFVYNVISNHVNVNGIQVERTVKTGKKEQIIELFQAGKSNKEISIELKTNYNYVYNTIKAFKASQPAQEEAK